MSKHTPGPWKAIKTPESTYYDDQVQIGRDRVGVYSEADAYLIAAAPALLAALRESRKVLAVAIRANWEGATDEDIASHLTIKQIDAAIAKATGEQP